MNSPLPQQRRNKGRGGLVPLALAAGLLAAVACGGLAALARSNSRQMLLRVVDADTGLPVPEVKIRAWVRVHPTDASGLCSIPLPVPPVDSAGYRVTLSKTGFVEQYITWSLGHHDKVQDMPAEFTANLEKAVSIGGKVVNGLGEPVPGAVVVLSGRRPADIWARVLNAVGPEFDSERTDAQGQWRFDQAPRALQSLSFHVVHADYAPADFSCAGTHGLSTEDLLAGKAMMKLGHGIVLAGRVTDAAGQPVAGAAITRNHQWRDPGARLSTDALGRFGISNLLREELCLTLQARGLAAQTRWLSLSNPMPELGFQMAPGRTFQGRVLDASGKPIAGATAQMDRLEPQPLQYDWSASTDQQGRFFWDSAPDGPHPYIFTAPGRHPRREPALLADGSEHLITLRPKTKGDKTCIDGQVIDAVSMAPIRNFTVSWKEFNGPAVAKYAQTAANADGHYTVSVHSDAAAYEISVAAPGWRAGTSHQRSPGDGDLRLNFALEKAR